MVIAAPKVEKYYPQKNVKVINKHHNQKLDSARRLKKLKVLTCVFVLVAFALGLAFTYFTAQIITKGHEINNIKKEIVSLQMSNERLQFEKQKLMSLDRVEALAMTELGMEKPKYENLLMVSVTEFESNTGFYSLRNSSDNTQDASFAAVDVENKKNIAGLIVAAISNVVSGLAVR